VAKEEDEAAEAQATKDEGEVEVGRCIPGSRPAGHIYTSNEQHMICRSVFNSSRVSNSVDRCARLQTVIENCDVEWRSTSEINEVKFPFTVANDATPVCADVSFDLFALSLDEMPLVSANFSLPFFRIALSRNCLRLFGSALI